jgi:hypothetical protein
LRQCPQLSTLFILQPFLRVGYNVGMKSISASIVVLSGAILIASGAHVKNDVQNFMILVGGAVGIVGLVAWYKVLIHERS